MPSIVLRKQRIARPSDVQLRFFRGRGNDGVVWQSFKKCFMTSRKRVFESEVQNLADLVLIVDFGKNSLRFSAIGDAPTAIAWLKAMSKKNKKSTRARLHNFELSKEKEAQELRAKKLQKKQIKLKVNMKKGVKVGKKVKFGSKKLSKSEKSAVVKSMEIDG